MVCIAQNVFKIVEYVWILAECVWIFTVIKPVNNNGNTGHAYF